MTARSVLRSVLVALAPVAAVLPLQPAEAQAKDTLVVALASHAPTLDPHMHFERVGILVNINMFDSLLHQNRQARVRALAGHVVEGADRHDVGVQAPQGREVPQRRDADRRGREVLLRPGARPRAKKSPQYGNIRAIKEVRIVDRGDRSTSSPTSRSRCSSSAWSSSGIVPKKHVEKVGDQAFGTTAPVGTGPWKFVEWKRDQHIRLEAFDQHWRGKPAFKHLVFRAVPEVATQVAELKTGGVDIIRNVSADLVPELKAHPQTYVSSTPDPARPLRRAGHADPALRQEGRAPGGELRDRQAGDHPEADGRARSRRWRPWCSRGLRLRPGRQAVPLRPEEGQGAARPGRLPERRGHHPAQRLRRVPPGLRGHRARC